MKMNMDRSADLSFLVSGQDEDVQQELDTYVELGQRRGRGTHVSKYCMLLFPKCDTCP